MLKIILPFVIVISVSILILLTYGPSEEEKKEALTSFIQEDFHYRDTVLTYELGTSKLTIFFPKNPQYKQWTIEAWADRRDEEGDKEIYFGDGTRTIRNGKVVIQLNPNTIKNPEEYKVTLFAGPETGNEFVISEPQGTFRTEFRENETDKGVLRPDPDWIRLKFVKFNMSALNGMDSQLKEYCLKTMKRRFMNAIR